MHKFVKWKKKLRAQVELENLILITQTLHISYHKYF